MRIPLLVYLGAAAEAAPLIAAAAARQPQSGARAWVLAWTGVLVFADVLELILALRGVRNLWVGYCATAAGALVLWGLSYWQVSETERLTLRVATFLFLAAWVVLTLAFDDMSNFSRAGNPMANTACLIASVWTLLTRSFRHRGELLAQDWFWVSAGVALYFGLWSAMTLMRALLFGHNWLLMTRLDEIGFVVNIVAFLAIARGVTCRVEI